MYDIYNKSGGVILDIKVDDESSGIALYERKIQLYFELIMQIKRGNTVIADVFVKSSAYTLEEINGQYIAYLEFDERNPVNLTINDYIEYMGNTYYIRYKESVQKTMTSLGYSYRVTFYHEVYKLHDVVFSPYDKIEFKKHTSTLTVNADEILGLVVKCMNRVSSGWETGESIETKKQTFNFKDKTCAEVVNDVISTFNTEYWVEGKTINFGKREYDSNGLVLSQGGGFKNLTLEAVDDTPPITRLYAYGSDQNLPTGYGDYLRLPGDKLYLEKNVDKYGVIEHQKQFENIYPKGEFHVSEKIDNFTFIASPNLDFNIKDLLIEGVEPIITFQNGGLGGYDFSIDAEKSDFESPKKKIVLIENSEENAQKVPGDKIHFDEKDIFILTGIQMPKKFIDSASIELEDEAQKWLDEKCENRIQLKGDCDEIEFAERDIHIACGQMLGVYDQKLEINREIRVTSVKRYIENDEETPYRYEIILSDFLSTNGFGQIVDEIKDIPNKIEKEVKPVKRYSERRWRDTIELGNALQDAFKDFSEGVNPVFVRTMQLVAGDERLQFRFVDSFTNPKEVDHDFDYNKDTKTFSTGLAKIQHMTLGIDTFAPSHNISEYRFWETSEKFSYRIPDTGAYWLYAQCSKNGTVAKFLLSNKIIEINSDPKYYHFVVGYLNSEYEDSRSFVTLYGYTEILPGQVRVNKVISTDGTQYFDMAAKRFRIGDNNSFLSYNVDAPNQLRLKGTIVQSSSGETDYLEVDRGNWVANMTYYPGDKVKYTNGNIYKCIRVNTNLLPTYEYYWKLLISKGDKGDKGEPGATGSTGPTGPTGPALNFRGDWSSSKSYELTTIRRDIVKHGSTYYARANKMGSTRTLVTNTDYWEVLNSFESIATGLLFADTANISGWNFNNNFIWSKDNRCILDGNGGYNSTPVIALGSNAMKTENGKLVVNPNAELKLFAGGTLTAGTGVAESNSGITGQGGTGNSVRFWAGDTFANRHKAPFRITQDGSMVANNMTATGSFQTAVDKYRVVIDASVSNPYKISMFDKNNQPAVRMYVDDYGYTFIDVLGSNTKTFISTAGIGYKYGSATSFSVRLYPPTPGYQNLLNKLIVELKNLPTSASGLSSGMLWRDGDNLKIVP